MLISFYCEDLGRGGNGDGDGVGDSNFPRGLKTETFIPFGFCHVTPQKKISEGRKKYRRKKILKVVFYAKCKKKNCGVTQKNIRIFLSDVSFLGCSGCFRVRGWYDPKKIAFPPIPRLRVLGSKLLGQNLLGFAL